MLEYARDNHYGKTNISTHSGGYNARSDVGFLSGLKKASVSDLCSLLHQHSRGSHNRRTDDDVTMDLDSDNLDEQQDECIDEGDSEMARGSTKAGSLARAAIAEADHQEKDENEAKNDNQPVGDGEKPDDHNASTEDVRAMWGTPTVSTHVLTVVQQTLGTIERIQEAHEKEKKEAEQREMRLKNQITKMNDKLTGLMTLMERQAIEMEKGEVQTTN